MNINLNQTMLKGKKIERKKKTKLKMQKKTKQMTMKHIDFSRNNSSYMK